MENQEDNIQHLQKELNEVRDKKRQLQFELQLVQRQAEEESTADIHAQESTNKQQLDIVSQQLQDLRMQQSHDIEHIAQLRNLLERRNKQLKLQESILDDKSHLLHSLQLQIKGMMEHVSRGSVVLNAQEEAAALRHKALVSASVLPLAISSDDLSSGGNTSVAFGPTVETAVVGENLRRSSVQDKQFDTEFTQRLQQLDALEGTLRALGDPDELESTLTNLRTTAATLRRDLIELSPPHPLRTISAEVTTRLLQTPEHTTDENENSDEEEKEGSSDEVKKTDELPVIVHSPHPYHSVDTTSTPERSQAFNASSTSPTSKDNS